MSQDNLVYLDTYILQKDMRVRMPKSILENLNMEKGKSLFKIYYDKNNSQLVLRVEDSKHDSTTLNEERK